MADVQPFRAVHYDRDRVGGLHAVLAPPYDVIDAEQRAALIARSPHNVVGIEDYGAGRIRPHERTHPGPKEDRLRLTRATNANLSPIFSLYDDPAQAAYGALDAAKQEPWAEVTDEDGTIHRMWRIADPHAA